MLKMLKKKTIWSQKKITRIKKREREIGEEEVRHDPAPTHLDVMVLVLSAFA